MVKRKIHVAEKYAYDVVAGKIPVCKEIIQTCKRYIHDRENSKDYYIDEEIAQAYIDFIQQMPLTKGRLAGVPLKLEPWQLFIIWNIYGWHKKKDGYRRFNKVTISVPKKNGKTELIAAIALAHTILDDEFGAEIYIAATSRNQAGICFKAAKTMVRLCKPLQEIIEPLQSGLFYEARNSSIKAISSEAGGIEGGGTSLAVYDEEHEQKDTELKDNLITGQAGKDQPLFISISTAGLDKNRPYYDHIKDCKKILDGILTEENHFIMIYGLDEGDDWRDPKSLIKANPNYGVSVIPDNVLEKQLEAIQKPSFQASFKTKHLNIWTDADKTWIPYEVWQKNSREIKIQEYYGKPCYVGIDLASSRDFTAVAFMFENGDGSFTNFWKYYIPEESMEERSKKDNLKFRLWEELGYIQITPGNVVDYKYIENDILELSKNVTMTAVSYDPHNSSEIVTNFIGAGLPMNKFPQGINYMSQPTKEMEKLIMSGKFLHDGNLVTSWMLSNVVIYVDANENIKPHRGKSANKIDGIIATINAMGGYLQLKLEGVNNTSVYSERGVRTL